MKSPSTVFFARHSDLPEGRHGPAFGGHGDVDRVRRVVCDRLAFGQLCKRAAFGFQIVDQLVAGADDCQRSGIAAGDETVFFKVASRHIAFKADAAEREFRTRRHRYDHRYGCAVVEHRIGGQIVHVLAGDGDLDDAAIPGVFIESCDQPVPVISCLYQKAKIAGGGFVLVCQKERAVLEAACQRFVGIGRVERDGIFDRIDNLNLRFFRTPEAHTEQFEGKGVAGKSRIQGERHGNRKSGASFPIRNTCLRVSPFSSHKLLYG